MSPCETNRSTNALPIAPVPPLMNTRLGSAWVIAPSSENKILRLNAEEPLQRHSGRALLRRWGGSFVPAGGEASDEPGDFIFVPGVRANDLLGLILNGFVQIGAPVDAEVPNEDLEMIIVHYSLER